MAWSQEAADQMRFVWARRSFESPPRRAQQGLGSAGFFGPESRGWSPQSSGLESASGWSSLETGTGILSGERLPGKPSGGRLPETLVGSSPTPALDRGSGLSSPGQRSSEAIEGDARGKPAQRLGRRATRCRREGGAETSPPCEAGASLRAPSAQALHLQGRQKAMLGAYEDPNAEEAGIAPVSEL